MLHERVQNIRSVHKGRRGRPFVRAWRAVLAKEEHLLVVSRHPVDEAEYLGAPPVGVADPDVVMSVRGVDMNAHSVDGGIGRKGCKLACEFRLAVLLSESPASPSDSTQPLSSCRLWYEHL